MVWAPRAPTNLALPPINSHPRENPKHPSLHDMNKLSPSKWKVDSIYFREKAEMPCFIYYRKKETPGSPVLQLYKKQQTQTS
jgi:hypothetical protein